jgi:spore maturation protein CgeB
VRALVVAATDPRTSDAALLLAAAFTRAGCTTELVAYDEGLSAVAEIARRRGGLTDPLYLSSFNHHLLDRARNFRPEVVILYGSNWAVLPRTIDRLHSGGASVVLWEINQALRFAHQVESLPRYDHVFSLDSYVVPVLEIQGARRVDHLPACADPDEHAPIDLTDPDRVRYGSDVCFIGSNRLGREEMLLAVADHELAVYGVGWDDVPAELAACVRSEPVYGLKKTMIYAASKISLNVHGPHMLNGENFRVFEVAACGGLSCSTFKPDLVNALTPDHEVIVFDGADDLRKRVGHLLAHPDELAEIAAAGRRRVLAEHTYDHRAATILDAARAT